jgi:acylphosphatase
MTRQRREVWYQGHVQGVGFRYTVAGIARRYPITGFVRNLPDRRVHVVCEGSDDDLKQFLADIAERMEPFIRDLQQDCRPETGQFSRFEIRH